MLLVALFMVIPEDNPAKSGAELVIVGVISAISSGPRFIAALRSRGATIGFRGLLLRFGVSALAFLGLADCRAALIFKDYEDALTVLVMITVLVFVISLRNSWDLLVTVAAVEVTAGGTVSPQ